MSAYEHAIRRELEYWPGTKVEFTLRSKHAQAVLHFGEMTRFVVYPVTPSDETRGPLNALTDVRKELRAMGAQKLERRPSARNRGRKVIGSRRPTRDVLSNIELAPVRPNPFDALASIRFSEPVKLSRWQTFVARIRGFFA